jgi:biopolymer transport protein ExbD
MELALPSASSGKQAVADGQPRLSVNVLADGSVILGSTPTSLEEMPARLRVELEKLGPDMELRIRADRTVTYSVIEPVLLACAESGIWNVTFAVVQKDRGTGSEE